MECIAIYFCLLYYNLPKYLQMKSSRLGHYLLIYKYIYIYVLFTIIIKLNNYYKIA